MSTELHPFAGRVREFITRTTSLPVSPELHAEFESLALELHHLQQRHNPVVRDGNADRPKGGQTQLLTEVAAIPTAAFKEFEVTCIPESERTREFHSSGTTGQRPSRHFHHGDSLELYDTAAWAGFQRRWPDLRPPEIFGSLTPSADLAPHSSLVHMFELWAARLKIRSSLFWGENGPDGWTVPTQRVVESISALQNPILLVGTAFNFVHLLDDLEHRGCRLPLPAGSWVVETGGYKGRSRNVPREDLHQAIATRLGVLPIRIITEYGMSELSSQAYSTVTANGQPSARLQFPPWARARIVSPESGREVDIGEVGLVQILDLANVWSAFAIQTEDLARRQEDGFELVGRALRAEPRGCSLQSAGPI